MVCGCLAGGYGLRRSIQIQFCVGLLDSRCFLGDWCWGGGVAVLLSLVMFKWL